MIFCIQFNKCLQQNKTMSKNKQNPKKQTPKVQPIVQPPPIVLTKQQKINRLINLSNDSMFQSIQSGGTKIQNVDKIANELVKQKSSSIFEEIMHGQFQVYEKPIPFELSKRKLLKYANLQEQFEDLSTFKAQPIPIDQSQINSINLSLKQLHQSIRREKQIEKNESKKLEQKAKQFILKVQKEKEQFEEKLKSKKSQSRLFVRAYSEDTIRVLKDKLALRVQEKKDQLAQKLKNIEKRKAERLQHSVNGEVSYWQKVKQYESCKNLKRDQTSESLLPQIKYPLSSSRSSRYEQVKNNLFKGNDQYDNSGSVLSNKFDRIDNYVLKAKLKLQQFQKNSKHQESRSRLQIIDSQTKDNFGDLYISNKSYVSSNKDHSEHRFSLIDKLREDLAQNRLKKIDEGKKDEGKKFPLKNHSKSNSLKIHVQLSPLIGSSKEINPEIENLSVNASNLKPGKNPNHTTLEESWNLILNKIKFHDINKVEGLAQLSEIEKRLDKYDKTGIANRLKMKAMAIAEIEREKIEISESKIIQGQKDLKNQQYKEESFNLSKLNSQVVGKQKLKAFDSSQNQFISKQFKRKA